MFVVVRALVVVVVVVACVAIHLVVPRDVDAFVFVPHLVLVVHTTFVVVVEFVRHLVVASSLDVLVCVSVIRILVVVEMSFGPATWIDVVLAHVATPTTIVVVVVNSHHLDSWSQRYCVPPLRRHSTTTDRLVSTAMI